MKAVIFSPEALRHLDEWRAVDVKMIAKIISLTIEISSNPFAGTGKPEPLKFDLKGKWSRRINQEHRIVYEVRDHDIRIVSCRYHYER